MMKRFLFGILAAVLFILPGCHNEMDDLLGLWQAELDMKDVLLDRMEQECPGIEAYVALDSFPVTVELAFYGDSTYQVQLVQQSVYAACEAVTPALEQGIWDYWAALYAQQAPGGDLEAYLQSLGVTRQELMAEVMGDTLAQELILQINLSQEGQFTLEKGKLRFSEALEETPDEDSYHTYKVKGKTLTIHPGQYSTKAQERYYTQKLPLTFQKQ